MYLAPAYLLVAIRRGQGYPMRVFVGTALAFLVLIGLRLVRESANLGWSYICFPPFLAICTWAAQTLIREDRMRNPGLPRCKMCEYDLQGNVTGICPECGTPTGKLGDPLPEIVPATPPAPEK
ncbi:MAG: hypothetical protein AABZ47_00260 [Planctomycetota bacterium]